MPTRTEIEAELTADGGFTRESLARWGVPWPPPKGWKKRLLRDHADFKAGESAGLKGEPLGFVSAAFDAGHKLGSADAAKVQKPLSLADARAHLADDGALRWTEGTRAQYLERSHELLVAIVSNHGSAN